MRPVRFSLLVLVLLFAFGGRSAAACVGDCDADGSVTLAELVTGVSAALGTRPIADCEAIDRNGDLAASVDEVLTAVNSSLIACPIFPSDYRASFVEVRDCRLSIEHGGVNIRVLASPDSARPYLDAANPLPIGSVLVKEEFDGPGCDDRDFVRWRVMRKEAPGFDSEDGDWHWQWVEPNFAVRFDDKQTGSCIDCHRAAECLARDYMCTKGEPGDLQVILQDLSGALLSVAGTSPSDVYAVGTDTGDGKGPYVLHYDGESWEQLETGASGDLWWISVTPIDGSFYMAGDGGLILEYDLETRQFKRYETPGDALLFGIWGPTESDLWAVGDDKEGGGVIWHYDGNEWTVVDLTGVRDQVPPLFKVWGPRGDDVYAVGQEGVILRFGGTGWMDVPSPTTLPLFTVHGNDTLVVATGGFFDENVIIELEDGSFVTRPAVGTPQLNGVFIAPDGTGAAVGKERTIALRADGAWKLHDRVAREDREYHAVWIDPEGGIWTVGGDLSLPGNGLLSYSGEEVIGREIRAGAD
jgi:hypothetical protein